MSDELKPGLIADRDGELFWYSGTVAVPKEYDSSLTWGGGMGLRSTVALRRAPWRQVSILVSVVAPVGLSEQGDQPT